MLTITLKEGQKFHIGDDITVYVRANVNRSNKVKLSIEAPENVLVLRDRLKKTSED